MLGIAGVTSTGRTCRWLRIQARAVIWRRFRRVLAPFTGQAYEEFVGVVRRSRALITGSSARGMLTGDVKHVMRDLNIVTPYEGFRILDEFVVGSLGYACISCVCHPALATGIAQFRKYSLSTQVITLASPGKRESGLHLILSAPTTADMVYMTTGGVTCFYPRWLEQNVVICSRTGNHVRWDNKLGCAREFHEDLRVEAGTAFIGEPCGNRCPTLWHHVWDKHLRKSVDWDITDSVTNTFHNVDIEWRLNAHCTNQACGYNITVMSRNVEGVGARNRADVKFLPGEIRCRQPRFLQWFKGIFYGAGCRRPFRVPIPMNDGVKRVPRLNDLYVNYWVRQRDLDAVTCTREHLQRTFNSVPNSSLELDGSYTVFFERPDPQAMLNRLLERMARMTGRSTAVNGSILVVKQSLGSDRRIVDMTRDDMLVTNFIINR
ncbi:hypothetical protein C8R48DRAFT_768564 [Suillus tomentosus]|nr:hypothetical protein C8R48DRAFT_768564 [Suillus tomentosus]